MAKYTGKKVLSKYKICCRIFDIILFISNKLLYWSTNHEFWNAFWYLITNFETFGCFEFITVNKISRLALIFEKFCFFASFPFRFCFGLNLDYLFSKPMPRVFVGYIITLYIGYFLVQPISLAILQGNYIVQIWYGYFLKSNFCSFSWRQ